jgi:hypothetical protein
MTDVTKEELCIIALGKLNYREEFDSLDTFKEVMETAQQGGKGDDPIDTSVSTDFQFNGDFEGVVTDLVDKGFFDVSGESYKLSEDGLDVWKRNPEEVSSEEFKSLKVAKTLYNN